MQKFLDQFKLGVMQALRLEAYIFACADEKVAGYHGGQWDSAVIDSVTILMIPGEGDATLSAAYSDVTTDRLTASVAFTSLVVNWWWHHNNDTLTEAQQDAFYNYHHALRDMVYDDNAKHTINKSHYFNITD